MNIPADASIPDDKITGYLLVLKIRNDKSKFLAQAGFTLQNPETLPRELRALIEKYEAIEDTRNVYGTFYRVEGLLTGVNGVQLKVVTIWLQRIIDGRFQFVTLKPNKEA
jgi:hypothetical protein